MAAEQATPGGKLAGWLVVGGLLVGVLVFVALPFIAGVGLSVILHGAGAIRDGALPWIVPICVLALISVMMMDSLAEAIIQRLVPGNKMAAQLLGFAAALGGITLAYGRFFVDILPALTGAFISALGLLVFIPMIKRSERTFRTRG